MGKVIDWSDVDWSQKNRDIAEQLGCAISTVKAVRKRAGMVGAGLPPGRFTEPVVLVSPDGEKFHIKHMGRFVAEHEHLFQPNDLRDDVYSSPAYYGLRSVRNGNSKSWKGWRREEADV